MLVDKLPRPANVIRGRRVVIDPRLRQLPGEEPEQPPEGRSAIVTGCHHSRSVGNRTFTYPPALAEPRNSAGLVGGIVAAELSVSEVLSITITGMNAIERRAAVRRLTELINDAWELSARPAQVGLSGSLRVDEPVFLALKAAAATVLQRMFGKKHAYTIEFAAQMKGPYVENVEIAGRILESALADLQALEDSATDSGISFDEMLHPIVMEHAYRHFRDEDYRESVFNAAIAVFDLLRTRTNLDLDGSQLATEVFSLQRPRLLVADIATETGRSEQVGVMQMLQGFYSAARNPKAHTLQHRTTRAVAAEYLVVASYLARRIAEASLPAA